MAVKIALDTNIAIEVLNNNIQTINTIRQFELIYLPITVCGELLFGAKNSSRAQSVATEYSDVKKYLKDIGSPIPENDIWIAALCKVYDVPLYTRDAHFSKIPALKLFK